MARTRLLREKIAILYQYFTTDGATEDSCIVIVLPDLMDVNDLLSKTEFIYLDGNLLQLIQIRFLYWQFFLWESRIGNIKQI